MIAPSNPYVSIGPILAVAEIRAALAARTVPCVAVSPLVGGRAVKGPADRMLQRLAGGTTPAHVAGCYPGLIDALVVDASDEAVELPAGVRRGRHEHADDRPRGRPAARRGGARRGRSARVRVAILGGTGSFGRALAARLVALGEDDVVIGSRDAERAQRDGAASSAAPASRARRTTTRCAAPTWSCWRSRPTRRSRRPRASRRRSARRRSSRSRARSSSRRASACCPDPEARSLAERIQDVVGGPVTAGLHSIAAANLDEAPPEEDALVCGDDEDAKLLALELAGKVVAGRALDAGPLASARALEGLTAVIVNLNRRYKAHAGIRGHAASRP